MSSYTIHEVSSKKDIKQFHLLPRRIYQGNPYWVHPLDNDIESRFDPRKNELFADGDARRWLLRDKNGEVVGRIAAFFNRQSAAIEEQPTGGCGFFECKDDQAAADLLFDTARDWLISNGMEAMDGPINFGDRDQWWGLLVEGFEHQPLYANPYNPPYYKDLFENYGFRNYFNQHTYSRDLNAGQLNSTVYERVKRLRDTPGYRFEYIDKKNLQKVAEDFRTIYNKAWASFPGVKPMDEQHSSKLMKTISPIMDPKLIYFAFFNDEPIGFFIMVPDLNRVIGRFRGKLNLINGIRLLSTLRFTRRADRIFGIIFGVSPEYHGKGIEAGIINEVENSFQRGEIRYKSLELAWIGDFNPVMMRMVESYVCAKRLKMHTTYRYLFDRTREFKRCPRLSGRKEK